MSILIMVSTLFSKYFRTLRMAFKLSLNLLNISDWTAILVVIKGYYSW